MRAGEITVDFTHCGVCHFDLHQAREGGYSTAIAVCEAFALRIPDEIDSQHAAPILGAGVTTYQPMKYFGLKHGEVMGVALISRTPMSKFLGGQSRATPTEAGATSG